MEEEEEEKKKKKNIVMTCSTEGWLKIERAVIYRRKVSEIYDNTRGNRRLNYVWNS